MALAADTPPDAGLCGALTVALAAWHVARWYGLRERNMRALIGSAPLCRTRRMECDAFGRRWRLRRC